MGKVKTAIVWAIFINPPVFNLRFGAGAGAASRYGSGSAKLFSILFLILIA
jgi:hypothetical protein